jgi:arylamine N-acetyltransferase
MTETLDLAAYFRRIGYDGPATATLETLDAVANHHARSIPFENLDPFGGTTPGLDVASLEAKLVHGRRGGWCFEQDRLLQLALDGIGFHTTGLAARVLWMRPPELPPGPRTHMLVKVDLDDGPHIVDVGFGGLTLTGAIRLEVDVEQQTPHELFRLVDLDDPDGALTLQVNLGGFWSNQYRFTQEPQVEVDYELGNWFLSTNPGSPFLQGVMAARPTDDTRYSFRNGTLMTYVMGREPVETTVTTVADVRELLVEVFGIDVPADDELDVRLASVLPTTSS